jgi:P4 family phage/plasmid primase-like protien
MTDIKLMTGAELTALRDSGDEGAVLFAAEYKRRMSHEPEAEPEQMAPEAEPEAEPEQMAPEAEPEPEQMAPEPEPAVDPYAEPNFENWLAADVEWPVQMFLHHNRHLFFHGDTLVNYDTGTGCYHAVDLEKTIPEFLSRFETIIKKADGYDKEVRRRFQATPARVARFLSRLADSLLMAGINETSAPKWIDPEGIAAPADQCLCFPNAILNLLNGTTCRPTPNLFSYTGFDFDYDRNATCSLWLKTVSDYWENRPDGSPAAEALLLQEIFGYLLLPATDLQKIFLLIGSGRNGKGVIVKILIWLLGQSNVFSLSMHDLGARYSRRGFIGKRLAVIAEGSFGGRDDVIAGTTFLKTVSGEDEITIKHRNGPPWIGTLPTRIMISANNNPGFVDASPALGMRIVSLQFTRAFTDAEQDHDLANKLKEELPGILVWAIAGLSRLRRAGQFTLPPSSVELTERIVRTASRGVLQFLEDSCDLGDNDVVRAPFAVSGI